MLLKSRVVPAGQAGTQKIVRLWIHEMYREFYDKLVEDSDRQFFFQTVKVCLFIQIFQCGALVKQMGVNISFPEHNFATITNVSVVLGKIIEWVNAEYHVQE